MQGYLFGIWCDYFLIIFGLRPEILIFIVFDYLILFLLFMELIVLAWQALSWYRQGRVAQNKLTELIDRVIH